MTASPPRASFPPPSPSAPQAGRASTVVACPSSVHELKTLVLSRHSAIVIDGCEEERLDTLARAAAGDLRLASFEWTVTQGLVRLPAGAPVYGTEDPGKALAAMSELEVEALYLLKDFAAHLGAPALSRAFREMLEAFARPGRLSTVVLAGSAVALRPEIEPHVVRFEVPMPGPEDYRRTIAAVVESLRLGGRARVELSAQEVERFTTALRGLTLNQARQTIARVAIDDGRLCRDDLARVVELKARVLREESLLEFFPAADNPARLGGFANLQHWLARARVGFSQQAAELNLPPPRGVLLVGVQGCGKSLAAKAIAREWGLPLLKLDAGRLFDKFVGESERNFRRAITAAESMAPVVLWIDEIEKGLVPSGSGDADAGLGRRLFGSFLTWLQEKRKEVFVVATANDLSRVPPELLRKGRFDEVFFVDLPDAAEREAILHIHLELRRQDPARFDLARLVSATDGFSGAELEQAVIASLLRALQEGRELDTEMLLAEIGGTVPLSVSRREDVERLRALGRERFVAVR